jgi:poly(hydroxyalkanoate) depolymerase family esterase
VLNLEKTLANFAGKPDRWKQLLRGTIHAPHQDLDGTPLRERQAFGPNPGELRMFSYVPARLAADPALVVVLHGCTQTAAGYDQGSGWSTLADRFGFALLFPEQQRSNNPNLCFNWFQPGDIERGRGEAASIRQMIETMATDHGIDRRRIFIGGLSAGGAMTSVMLACYPDVFAAGAIIAGLPYGAATTMQQAFQSMNQSPARPAREWGDLVRAASSHAGPWPRVSVWHGGADRTVIPSNANEIIKQWTDVHGLPMTPSHKAMVDGYPRQAWQDGDGHDVIEFYAITHMAHGTPLATGTADDTCGAAGPFLLDVGISSSYHIARFFGLVPAGAASDLLRHTTAAAPNDGAPLRGRLERLPPASAPLDGEVLEREPRPARPNAGAPRHSALDIGAMITSALKAAGLMRDR